MERLTDIELAIRDSKQVKIDIQYPRFTENTYSKGQLTLTFEKFEKKQIVLTLIEPTLVDLFDNAINDAYISHIKAFEQVDGCTISLDPHDEAINEIEDRDNYVFQSKAYAITTTDI